MEMEEGEEDLVLCFHLYDFQIQAKWELWRQNLEYWSGEGC